MRFSRPALFEHRPGAAHDAAHDRVVALGQPLKILQEVGADVGAKRHRIAGPSTSFGASPRRCGCRETPSVRPPGGSGLRNRPQRLVSVVGHGRAPVRKRINSSRIHSPPSNGVPSTCGAPLAERRQQVPKLHRVELDRRRRAEDHVRRVAGDTAQKPAAACLGSAASRPFCSAARPAPCAPRPGSRRRTSSSPARRARPRRRR